MLFVILLIVALTPARPLAVDNPIVVENQQPGSSAWQWSKLADDVNQQIKGYASLTSVNQNENITFNVSVNPAQNYTIDFYRFGYYQGLGARLRLHVGPIAGIQQPACPTDATTGKIECNWSPGYVLTVPNDWTSGVYGAMLTNDQGYQNFVIFVVKDGRPAPYLYQQSVATDQAYNNYPNDGVTGKSIYGFNSYGATTVSGNTAAVKVSFDRPEFDSGLGNFYKWEMDFIRFIEKSGYDVTYSTDID
ncbi:MAG TPA: N,N-dimethylformamidase beta subunit family domain-containing protein, partial [Vicinamibacterales bacterium]|nr:N,N-dimethylformamidase beta subunit family domain-containing protein [Vicinamibacterales bacterium]